jgi:hypothetical protein
MAEGGTDGEFIANVYDDYDAEVGTTVTSMYAKGGKISDMTYIGTLYDADDAMNAKKELLKTGNFTDIKIQKVKQAYQLNKYARGNENYFMWRIYVDLSDDIDSPSKYEKLSKKWKSIIQKNETYKGRHKVYADGGMMAYAYGGKDYRIVGFYSDGFEEDLGNSNDLSEAIEMANAEQMKYPEYVSVKVLEVFGQKNSDFGDYEVIEYYSTNDKKALGGFFGNSRYNTGRSWHLDHARHNKKENYEKPLNKRSRRFKRK